MALHTKKDFAGMCGMNTRKLSIYIGRKKVVLTGEYINDTDEKNVLFLAKYGGKEPKKDAKVEVVAESVSAIATKEVVPEMVVENNNEEKQEGRATLSLIQLEKEKKLADLAKVEADTVYRQLQIDKLTGTSIPTDLVKNVVSSLSKSFVAGFKDGADGFLIEISKRFGINNADLAGLRGKLVEVINGSIKKSVEQSRRDLKRITDNYSAKREVGEHD